MRGRIVARRAWLWAGMGIAVGLGIVLEAGRQGRARATEAPESARRMGEDVAAARALVTQLEVQQRSIDTSLQKARELLAKLEGKGAPGQPIRGPVPNLRNANGDDLEGVWHLVGVRSTAGGEFQAPAFNNFKIMTTDHYLWVVFDPHTGKATRWTGGSYWLRDGKYTGRIEYANSDDQRAMIGKEYQFNCKVGGDRWEHSGTLPNGVRIDDLWVRIDPHP